MATSHPGARIAPSAINRPGVPFSRSPTDRSVDDVPTSDTTDTPQLDDLPLAADHGPVASRASLCKRQRTRTRQQGRPNTRALTTALRVLACVLLIRTRCHERVVRAFAGIHTGDAFKGEDMAKALFGHVGSAPDRRLLDEVTQLRAKVRSLEFEVARLRAENDRLAAAHADELLRLPEPALT